MNTYYVDGMGCPGDIRMNKKQILSIKISHIKEVFMISLASQKTDLIWSHAILRFL